MLKHEKIIEKLTIKQKISLLTDISCLSQAEYTDLGIPHTSISTLNDIFTDLGDNVSANMLARTWNPDAIDNLTGELVAAASRKGTDLVIAPSPKIKFSPYRSYMSEDPYLSGILAGAYVKAIHRVGIPACLSGFKLDENDVEYMDREIDRRVIYEYFISPFLVAAKAGDSRSVMGSVAGPGGAYGDLNLKLMLSAESGMFHTNMNVLCDEHTPEATAEVWHSGGIVVRGIASVLELAYEKYQRIIQAIQEGHATVTDLEDSYEDGSAISDDMIDVAVDRVISFAFDCQPEKEIADEVSEEEATEYDGQEQAEDIQEREKEISVDPRLAKCLSDTVRESIVLLKNESKMLPVRMKYGRIAVIGDIAMSSEYPDFAKQFSVALANPVLGFARGYALNEDKTDHLIEEAVKLAEGAEIVFLFLGMDKKRLCKLDQTKQLELPANQAALLDALNKYVNKLVVIVDGDILPAAKFDRNIKALLLAPIGGPNCARALADVVSGAYSPSGRLTESYYDDPSEMMEMLKRYKDIKRNKIGPFIGYRYYDSSDIRVRYPFGFGLSYTTFKYSNLRVYGKTVEFYLKNTGAVTGTEVVQVYIGYPQSNCVQPRKELKAFVKVELGAGEIKQIRINIPAPLTYDEVQKKFIVVNGEYDVYVCSSVSDVKLTGKMQCVGEAAVKAFDGQKQKRSDYLQSDSNIISDKYTLEAERKKMKKSWKWKIGYISCLAVAIIVNIANGALKSNFADALELFGGVIDETVSSINLYLLLLTVFFVAADIFTTIRMRRQRAIEDRKMSEQNFLDAENVESISIDDLFVQEFDEIAAREKKIKVHSGFDLSDMSQFVDNDLTFAAISAELTALAKEMGLELDEGTAATVLASFATSRLVGIDSVKDERLQKFTEMLARFFACPVYFEEINESFAGGDLLYVKDEAGNTRDSAVLKMINAAKEHKENVYFVTLNNVKAADLANLFAQYIRYLNNPQRESRISCKDMEDSILLPENIWFVISPANDQRVEELPIYMTELMSIPTVKYTDCEMAEEIGAHRTLGYYQINYLAEKCKNGLEMSEDFWKKMDRLEEYVNKHSSYKFGNKLSLRLEKYLAILKSCEFETAAAIDNAINASMLPVIQVALEGKVPDDDRGLLEMMETVFGDENIPTCSRTLKQSVAVGDADQVS